jgi:hypothetical protein
MVKFSLGKAKYHITGTFRRRLNKAHTNKRNTAVITIDELCHLHLSDRSARFWASVFSHQKYPTGPLIHSSNKFSNLALNSRNQRDCLTSLRLAVGGMDV